MKEKVYLTERFEKYLYDNRKDIPTQVVDIIKGDSCISKLKYGNNDTKVAWIEEKIHSDYRYVLFLIHKTGDVKLYLPRKVYDKDARFKEAKNNYENPEYDILIDSNEQGELSRFLTCDDLRYPLPDTMKLVNDRMNFKHWDSYVYEMDEWVSSIASKKYEGYFNTIFECLCSVFVDGKYPEDKFCNDGEWYIVEITTDLYFVYRHEISETEVFYLFRIQEDENIDDIKGVYSDKLTDLQKYSRKAYPCLMLYGTIKDGWEQIERDSSSNLALSQDEKEILTEHVRYPYFVNGLAGSGKSTILYYLYVNAFNENYNKEKKFIFLSYNNSLVKHSQNIITSLFKNNSAFLSEVKSESERERFVNKLGNSIMSFRKALKEMFIESGSDYMLKFDDSKHLDYDRFEREFRKSTLAIPPFQILPRKSYYCLVCY